MATRSARKKAGRAKAEKTVKLAEKPDIPIIVHSPSTARGLFGTLPVELRVLPDGRSVLRPAVLFSPPHLRAHDGNGDGNRATASQSYAVTGSNTADNSGNGSHNGDHSDDGEGDDDDHDHGHGHDQGHGHGHGHAHGHHHGHHHHGESEDDDTGTTTTTGDEDEEEDETHTPFPVIDAAGFLDLANAMLDPNSGNGASNASGAASSTAASYDFDEYVLLRNPEDPYAKEPMSNTAGQIIPSDPRFLRFTTEADVGISEFLNYARLPLPNTPQIALLAQVLQQSVLSPWWRQVCAVRAFNRLQEYDRDYIVTNTSLSPERWYGYNLGNYLGSFYRTEVQDYLSSNGDATKLGALLTVAAWEDIVESIFVQYFNWLPKVDPSAPKDDYPFEPYATNECLYALRVVHRQDWKRLDYARGELVRSVPLGPRESQRLSVKITSRTKSSRTTEQSTSFETSSESTNTSRDTTEVVDEASQKFNQHADAGISGGYGPFIQANISAGLSQDLGSLSRGTKTRLNELMEKTASRMKRDTKVTVSTESEQTFEDSRTSEITNPNDELGITYLYYRLQLRYWVTTSIAEVQSVVFVPQPVPAWTDITEAWIRDHADPLALALLDPSFAPVIAAIRQEPGTLQYQTTPVFSQAATAGINAAGTYRTFTGGGSMPDLLASGQEFFAKDYERRANLTMEQARRSHQTAAFITHLRRNILHYMRAIWADEDYDQRMQRYSRMRVPIAWYFVPRSPVPGTTPTPLEVDGVFMPDASSARPLTDVIDPIGPIGYHLNCAIYRLRDDMKLVNLHQALAYLRAAYTRFAVDVQPSVAGLTVRQAVAYSPRSFSANYILEFGVTRLRWLVRIAGQPEANWPTVAIMPDGSLDALGIRIWITGVPAGGNQLNVRLRVTADLEDPYYRLLKTTYPLPLPGDEPQIFTDATLTQMAFEFPELAGIRGLTWNTLSAAQKTLVRDRYYFYLMNRESGRLVTLDTPNLVLDLEGSTSPALEPFKRLHRYVDVLKEFEEMRRRSFENHRRNELLDERELGDPEIERVTLVGVPSTMSKLISVPSTESDD